MTHRSDHYARITDKIIADLEAGTRPWLRPWNTSQTTGRITRPLRQSGVPYRGVNVITLWLEANLRSYASPIWMTYRQAAALGGQVRKGERARRSSMPTTSRAPKPPRAARKLITLG